MSEDIIYEEISPGESKSPQLLEKEITLATGEVVKLSSVKIDQMRLWHGSAVPEISQFKGAEETTIGSGLYLTSQKEAALGYAFIRTGTGINKASPILYELEIRDMNILNLTTRATLMDFMKFFRQEIFRWAQEVLPTENGLSDNIRRLMKSVYYDRYKELNTAIREGRVMQPKQFLMNCGGVLRSVLMSEGYDGVMAFEGGEYGHNPFTGEEFNIGTHDSYVIFEPEKAKKINEEKITQ